jgi:hypothetical protein
MLFLTHHLGSTLFCVVVQKLAEIAKQSLAMGNPDLWEMVVSEMWVDLQWTLEGMLSDLETALSQRTGQNCQGAFWRRLDLSVDDTSVALFQRKPAIAYLSQLSYAGCPRMS